LHCYCANLREINIFYLCNKKCKSYFDEPRFELIVDDDVVAVAFEAVPETKKIQAGADVMITVFCEFRQFSAKKLVIFSKTNVMIQVSKNSCILYKYRKFFADFFGEKNSKIITSVPAQKSG
jgi:hypothetical protein